MRLRLLLATLLVGLLPGVLQTAAAQAGAPAPEANAPGWHLLERTPSGAPGINLEGARRLLEGRTPQPVIVAVIDSGVDPQHPALQPVLWTNPDPDAPPYAGDVHGWNFLGNAAGENVHYDTYEVTRLVAGIRARLADGTATAEDRARLPALEAEMDEKRQEYTFTLLFGGMLYRQAYEADSLLQARFGPFDDPAALEVGMDAQARQARDLLVEMNAQGLSLDVLDRVLEQAAGALEHGFNPDFDPRPIIGDDYDDVDDRAYGNPDVHGPDPSHGTGVAGLIASADAGTGVVGIAPAARILAVRAVPDGDERDKDVANAIRYAADMGARIINMSFGKGHSPRKDAVDAAVRYAAARGVLFVHAAGNDGKDLDAETSFPNRYFLGGGQASAWLTVGASADAADLAASFSNYGQTTVDLFAPGARVTSLAPGGETTVADGTSFAAPIVAGVAALVMSYFPELSADEVRQILLDSATRPDAEVQVPGGEARVPFASLSATGGVVNAAEAVRLALERTR